jgi:hypothetical protein
MSEQVVQEWGMFAALLLLAPYAIGVPLAILWGVGAALVAALGKEASE